MSLMRISLPTGARNIRLENGQVLMEVDGPALADMSSPTPVPPGGRFPDWRWRRLMASERTAEFGGRKAVAESMADDDWLHRVILPCRWYQAGWVERPGPFQEHFENACWLAKQRNILVAEVAAQTLKVEAGILNGWSPEMLAETLGGYPVTYRMYEALFFNAGDRRGDLPWLRDAVFRPLSDPEGSLAERLFLRAALHLDPSTFMRVVHHPVPPGDRRWLGSMPDPYQRLYYWAIVENMVLDLLRRAKQPASVLAELQAEWAVTPPPDEAGMDAWLRLLPPYTWKRFPVRPTAHSSSRRSRAADSDLDPFRPSPLFRQMIRFEKELRKCFTPIPESSGKIPMGPVRPRKKT